MAKTKPPVAPKGITKEMIAEMISDADSLAAGEFATDGLVYAFDPNNADDVKKLPAVEKAIREGDDVPDDVTAAAQARIGRTKAGAQAAKYVRVMDSRTTASYRSRTWEVEGGFAFGIRPKDSNGETTDADADTPDADADSDADAQAGADSESPTPPETPAPKRSSAKRSSGKRSSGKRSSGKR